MTRTATRPLLTKPPRRTPATRVAGFLVVGAALLWFVASSRPTALTFDLDRPALLQQWNRRAAELGRTVFEVPNLDWTDESQGVFGYAWSETMSVIGRVDDGTGKLQELVVVGAPSEDGRGPLIDAMDLMVAVLEPQMTDAERADLLSQMGLSRDTGPAEPVGTVDTDIATYRVAVGLDTGRLGLGAAPVSPKR